MIRVRVTLMNNGGWYVIGPDEPPGINSQARTLDECVYMIRDAVDLMYDEDRVQVELIVPPHLDPTRMADLRRTRRERERKAKALRKERRKADLAVAVVHC